MTWSLLLNNLQSNQVAQLYMKHWCVPLTVGLQQCFLTLSYLVLQGKDYLVMCDNGASRWPHLDQHSCWPLTVVFLSLAGHRDLKNLLTPAFISAPESWPDALWPGLGELLARSLGPPLLLTVDASYKCHHNHCDCSSCSRVDLGWDTGVLLSSALLSWPKEATSLPLSKEGGASVPPSNLCICPRKLEKMPGAHPFPQHRGIAMSLSGTVPSLLVRGCWSAVGWRTISVVRP